MNTDLPLPGGTGEAAGLSSGSSQPDERISARCWLCESDRLTLAKPSNVTGRLTSEAFQITDARYGMTLAIYRCEACGFLQCSGAADPVEFYAEMVDDEYEDTRPSRLRQAREIVGRVARFKAKGSWLDIGAGSGILVEAARDAGFAAKGVEPSDWLAARGRARGLDIFSGVLPHPDIRETFDVVSLVDVVEHVTDPVGLLRNIAAALKPDALACIVTPDVNSLLARFLKWNWWHFRVAHVGYFSLGTLDLALRAAALRRDRLFRPTWHLPADYLVERALQYAPRGMPSRAPKFLGRFTVPVNLYDSLMVFVSKSGEA